MFTYQVSAVDASPGTVGSVAGPVGSMAGPVGRYKGQHYGCRQDVDRYHAPKT